MMNSNACIRPLTSPLRYPGGKAFLCEYVQDFLRANELHPDIMVEPFAGGASVSLYLVGKGVVGSIALYDLDPMIASFWWAAVNDAQWLRSKFRRTDVTLDNWKRVHTQAMNGNRTNAWKCLFLNRTNFSGIIRDDAGPLGGKSQKSKYSIDCRYYVDTTLTRLQDIWACRERIVEIGEADWEDTVRHYMCRFGDEDVDRCFLYLDPPFYHKAESLYNYYFKEHDHEHLLSVLSRVGIPWLLSYDDCEEVETLLDRFEISFHRFPVRYSSSSCSPRSQKFEIVATNRKLPTTSRECKS